MKIFASLIALLALVGCSSAYKNEEFERTQRVTIEFTNAHIAQRHIDAFAHFRFEKKDIVETVEDIRSFSKKSGQYKAWKNSLEGFASWLKEVKEPGNYIYDQGFAGRNSLVTLLLHDDKGEVCPSRSGRCWKRSDIQAKKPSEDHLRRHAKWAAEPPKVKKYFVNDEDERIWPEMTLKLNSYGE